MIRLTKSIVSMMIIAFIAGTIVPAQAEMMHFWSKGFGSTTAEYAYGVATDVTGNVYAIGTFSTDFAMGEGALTLTTAGSNDVYFAKYDANGTHLWSKSLGGTGDDTGSDVTVDSSGNVLIIGSFKQTVNFGGVGLTSLGNYDIFLAKYDTDGNHIWSKRLGGTDYDYGRKVVTDASNNIFITSTFRGSVDFGGGSLNSVSWDDIVLAKYNASGTHQWSKRFGNTELDYGYGIAADSGGNVLLTGSFNGSVDFGGGAFDSNDGSKDMFLVKYDSAGNHIWSKSYGEDNREAGNSVAVDSSDNVIVTGYYYNNDVDFGGGTLRSKGDDDIFIAKYDSSGNHIWSKGLGDSYEDAGNDVAVDSNDNIIIIGYFSNTVDFGGGSLSAEGEDYYDIFIARYAADGTHLSSLGYGGTSDEYGNSVAVDADGNAIIFGEFKENSDFGGGLLTNNGNKDLVLAKYGPPPPAPGGVSANLQLWLKADTGAGTNDGDSVNTWTDQSINERDATATTAPSYESAEADQINFNPVVHFDNTGDQLLISGGAYDSRDVIMVVKGKTSNLVCVYDNEAEGTENFDLKQNDGIVFNSNNLIVNAESWNYNTGSEGTVAGVYYVNGVQTTVTPENALLLITVDKPQTENFAYEINSGDGGVNFWQGDIAEFIVYSSDLTADEHNKIESYLAIKYGINKAGSYVDSDGTTIWDATANATYHNNVFGIGKDDDSTLNQTQSKSANNDAIVTISNPDDMTDGEFMLCGNNNAALTEQFSEMPDTFTRRLARQWKLTETGDPGNLTLTIDVSALSLTGTVAILLLDTDGDFSNATPLTANSYTSGVAIWNNINLTNNSFFTLATEYGAELGDYVWKDFDNDGIMDDDDTFFKDITVKIFTSGDVLYYSTTTDNGGKYSFENIPSGDYYIQFTAPTGWEFSPQNQGSDDTKDSDADATTGRTANFTVTSGLLNLDFDAGLYHQPVSYYVSETGNDTTGDGLTPGTAWATLAKTIAQTAEYDTININGTITEDGIWLLGNRLIFQGEGADVSILQPATTAGTASDRMFYIRNNAEIEFRNLTLRHGYYSGDGSLIDCNTASSLTFDGCLITDNQAHSGTSRKGGAVYFFPGENAKLTIQNSTISNNSNSGKGGALGIDLYGSSDDYEVIITNTTITGNTADGNGGAIWVEKSSSKTVDIKLTNATMTNNATTGGVGNGIYMESSGGVYNLNLLNTILDNGTDNYASSGGATFNVNRTYTISSDDSLPDGGINGNLDNTNPMLGTLSVCENGLQFHPLQDGSPAIDAGDETSAPTTDQCGNDRVVGTYNIGASESVLPPIKEVKAVVPTLNEWGIIFFIGLLLIIAINQMRTSKHKPIVNVL